MSLGHSTPSRSLLNELEEVAESSLLLIEEVERSNALPKDFPKDSLFDLCMGLSDLRYGTAEGCRVPLEYARMRLPSLRRSFFLKDDDDIDNPPADEPSLGRGRPVDKALQLLIASVTTALDEYRALASESRSDRASTDPEYDSVQLDKSGVITESASVSATLGKQSDKLSKVLETSSVNGQRLQRILRDAETVNKLARSEAKRRKIVTTWLKSLAAKMSDFPGLFRTAAKFIKISADVSEPLWKFWNDTTTEVIGLLFSRYKNLGEAFLHVAENLESSNITNAKRHPLEEGFEADIAAGFEHWVYTFVVQRMGEREYIDANLFYPEVKHLTGLTSSDFARSKGFATFKELLRSLTMVELIQSSSSYSVRPKTGRFKEEAIIAMRTRLLQSLFHIELFRREHSTGSKIPLTDFLYRSPTRSDKVYSYVKLTQQTIPDFFSSIDGLECDGELEGGTLIITDYEKFLEQALTPRFLKFIKQRWAK